MHQQDLDREREGVRKLREEKAGNDAAARRAADMETKLDAASRRAETAAREAERLRGDAAAAARELATARAKVTDLESTCQTLRGFEETAAESARKLSARAKEQEEQLQAATARLTLLQRDFAQVESTLRDAAKEDKRKTDAIDDMRRQALGSARARCVPREAAPARHGRASRRTRGGAPQRGSGARANAQRCPRHGAAAGVGASEPGETRGANQSARDPALDGP